MRHAEQSVEGVAERRDSVQVVEYDDGCGHLPGGSDVIAGSDVTAGGGALVGHAVEVVAQLAARLAVHLEH